MLPFRNRDDAGRQLGRELAGKLGKRDDLLVLGLPRGGVPVAARVAAALGAPLDVFIVRKLGVPGHEELAMGAIASGGIRVLNRDVLDHMPIPLRTIDRVVERDGRGALRARQRLEPLQLAQPRRRALAPRGRPRHSSHRLLTREEEAVDMRTGHLRFDIDLLAGRLVDAMEWMSREPSTNKLRVGLFGASTGGGAALVAAARVPDRVAAVVSRGGRPDLAGAALPKVKAPTLLIVGGDDVPVIGMNREAYDQMTCERRMEIVPGASHLFEEPGTLERVAELAREWFVRHLT